MIKLSNRLERIAYHIPKGSRFADIGSDHAYLCSYVCKSDSSAIAIAGEVRSGPLNAARKTIQTCQLEHRIQARLGDGLEVVADSDKLDTIVIAGMGGKLITEILLKGKEKLATIEHLIIQPNTNPEYVREFFVQSGFSLIDEELVEENDHIYEILVARKHTTINLYNSYDTMEKQLLFGPLLMQEKSTIFRKKWLREYKHIKKVQSQLEKSTQQTESESTFQIRRSWIEELFR